MQLLQKSTYQKTHNIIDADPVKHLEASTIEYLHMSFLLYEYKNGYSKREYRELLDGYGWDKGSSEERRALKLAEHFQDFAHRPHALIQIPVTTLLRLCSEKYKPIIEELNQLDEDDITCDRVLGLIKERQALLKKEKELELPEKPSIWHRNCRGERYAQFPPVYEDDQQTGVLTQKLMDEYGLIPQAILREAVADLYQKIREGQQEESAARDVNGVGVRVNDDNHYSEPIPSVNQIPTVKDKWQELSEQLQADVDDIGFLDHQTGNLIAENCQRWEAAVPQEKRWNAISNIVRHDGTSLKHLSNYAVNHNPLWRETWGATLASYQNFEQELAWVDTDVRNDALVSMGFDIPATVEIKTGNLRNRQGKVIGLNGENITPILVKVDGFNNYFHWSELEVVEETSRFRSYTSASEAQEYLEEPQESDLELEPTPLDKAIDVLIQGNWEDIRNIFNQYPEIKGEAWNSLCIEQKRRVIDITPDSVKVLNKAKKEGVIEEYKEITNGVYEIKLPGTLIWENRAFHEIEIYHQLRRWRDMSYSVN
ncbi:hypothetical protein [Rivularia sp. UHCC 0363]|uniref:hypothetical protein n=1 Tax=Rivularia sp. UHCC 0363 TaxID=3110244 RepID=UPI002B1EFF45|nr:hypothetical protein [Rivularia sp. UHCC 0363]MEA5594756.1 hypothetical protein [Rivularia sp. UHCC 0363]